MRFQIKDLLAATTIAALLLLLVREFAHVRQKHLEIAQGQERLAVAEQELAIATANLHGIDAKLDYFREVERIHEQALKSFEKIREEYSSVEATPGWVSYRIQPILKKPETEVIQYRIVVPSEFPVFLRSAMAFEDAIPSRGESDLDRQQWLQQGPLDDPTPHGIRLDPGIHDLFISVNDGQKRVTIMLDWQTIFQAVATDSKYSLSRSSYSSPREQSNFRFDKLSTEFGRYTNQLVTARLGPKGDEPLDQPEYRFYVWLSSTPQPELFPSYPSQVDESAEVNPNE